MSDAILLTPDVVLGTNMLLDRPGLSLMNLLEGNVGAAAESLYDPDALSPEQRQSMAARLGLTGSILEPLVNIVSNPMVIAGLVGTLMTRNPGAVARTLMKEGGAKASKLARSIAPMPEIVADTPLARLLMAAPAHAMKELLPHIERYNRMFDRFERAAGRYPTEAELRTLFEYREHTFSRSAKPWQSMAERAADDGFENVAEGILAKVEARNQQVRADWAALTEAQPAFKGLLRDTAAWTHNFARTILDPERAPYFYRMLKNSGDIAHLPRDVARTLEDYLPHLAERTYETEAADLAAAARQFVSGTREISQGATSATHRRNVMLPSRQRLSEFLDADELAFLDQYTAQGPAGPMYYSTDLGRVLRQYFHRAYNTLQFSVPMRKTPLYDLPKVALPPANEFAGLEWKREALADVLGPYADRPEAAWVAGYTAPTQRGNNIRRALAEAEVDPLPEQLIAKAAARFASRNPKQAVEAHRLMRQAITTYEGRGQTELAARAHAVYARQYPRAAAGIVHEAALGEQIHAQLGQLERSVEDPAYWKGVVRDIREVTLPQMMGAFTPKQLRSMQSFAGLKEWSAKQLRRLKEWGPVKQYAGALERAAERIERSPYSYAGLGHDITSYLTMTTLGAPNFLAPLTNMMQVVSNMSGMFGAKYARESWTYTIDQMRKYVVARAPKALGGQAMEANEAARKYLGDFGRNVLQLDATLGKATESTLENLTRQAVGAGKGTRAMDHLRNTLMAPFQFSELFNRMWSYNWARFHLQDELPGKVVYMASRGAKVRLPYRGQGKLRLLREAVDEHAAELMYATQFGTGPLQKPFMLTEWWQPLQQYLGYPIRQLNLLRNIVKDPAYAARTALVVGGLYATVRESLGVDYTRGLATGGIPQITEDSPFAPLQVPPFVGLVGAGMQAVGGDSEALRKALPTLVPGGVGLARLATALPGVEGVQRFTRRQYADYNAQTPDGRVPLYSADGALIGYFSKGQLFARALGVGDVGVEQEHALTSFALRQRDEVRQLKREYLEALSSGDSLSVKRIDELWRHKYPGLGPIPVRKQDMRSLHLRQDVTRLERVLETLPPELRPHFTTAIATSFGAEYPDILGLAEPGLSAGTTIQLREPYRARRMSSPGGGRQPLGLESRHGLKLRDRLLSEADTTAQNVELPGMFPATDTDSLLGGF